MASQEKTITKKRGRPATGLGQLIGVRLQPADLAALDAYRASDEPMTRPQAIRAALTDWLRTHGFAASDMVKPKGPATEVVEAMDAAIKEHRGSRSARKP